MGKAERNNSKSKYNQKRGVVVEGKQEAVKGPDVYELNLANIGGLLREWIWKQKIKSSQ